MFTSSSQSCEHGTAIDSTGHPTGGFQPLRVKPLQGGAWALPGIPTEVPTIIQAANFSATQSSLAAFGLCAHDLNVKLPGGQFSTVNHAVLQQWSRYIKGVTKHHDVPINLHVGLTVSEQHVQVTVSAPMQIQAYVLRPLVEQLNSCKPGLGWWAAEVVHGAGGQGIPLYTLADVADQLRYNYPEADRFTDRAMLRAIRENEGQPRLTRDYIDKHYGLIWPSELVEEAAGHAWLFKSRYLHQGKWELEVKPPRMPDSATVQQWLLKQKRLPAGVREIVQDFLDLDAERHRPDSTLGRAMSPSDIQESEDGEVDPYFEPPDILGAIGLIVWDQGAVKAWEVVSDYGEMVMNWGNTTTETAILKASVNDTDEMRHLVIYLKDLVARTSAIAKAFRHLPTCNSL